MDKAVIYADNFDEATFRVLDQDGKDVTQSAGIYYGNVSISDHKFTYSQPIVLNFRAVIGGIESNKISVAAVTPPPSPFTQKVYVENLAMSTSTICFPAIQQMDEYANRTSFCVFNTIHKGDSMENADAIALHNSIMNQSICMSHINRRRIWTPGGTQPDITINPEAALRAPLGIALETQIVGSTVNIVSKVKFDVNTSIELKLVLVVTEDSVLHNFHTPFIPSIIVNFPHKNVFRKLINGTEGDIIPVSFQASGKQWEKNYSVNLSAYNVQKCNIIAYVKYGNNYIGRWGMVNCQKVRAGKNQNFD